MTSSYTSILLDCDPGNDDALAILVAAGNQNLYLRAVTTGAGHLAADRTARNGAIVMARCAPVRVPVAAGAAGPLVRERLVARMLDLESALDPERPDLPAVELDPRHSAEVIVDTALAHPGLTIVTMGPFTNLALALRYVPAIAPNIARIVSLAGAWGLGNKTAAAEWNVLCDPEAAAAVIGAGIPMTLIPIDAAAQVIIDEDLIGAASQTGEPVAGFAVELLRSLQSTYRPGQFGPPHPPLNDPLAPMVAAYPGLAQTVPARVDVELAGRHTYGRTVVDFAGRSELPPNCDVVVGFDVTATRHEFLASLAGLAGRGA